MALNPNMRSGKLEKLTIAYEEQVAGRYTGRMEALFNPSQLVLNQSVSYCEKPMAGKGLYALYSRQVFQSTNPQSLTIDLFFDAYESHSGGATGVKLAAAVASNFPVSLNAPEAESVTRYTDVVAGLARVNRELHRPPVCDLRWGKFEIMRGVLTSLDQTFTMFLADGTPVRATLTCTFTQYRGDEQTMRQNEVHSPDVHKVHTIKRGDSLRSLAALYFGDPGLWREIARANQIINPLRPLTPGQTLRIPKL